MNLRSSNSSFHYIELIEIENENKTINPTQLTNPTPFQINESSSKSDYKFPYNLFRNMILTRRIKQRLLIITISVVIIYINNNFALFIPLEPNNNLSCINDTIFRLTDSINKYFHYHLLPRYLLMTTASILIDFLFIYSIIDWAFNYTGLRLILCWITFYLLRGIIQNIYQMTYPSGYFWGNPYFPSLVVCYLDTNDFFFSGHVGMPLITGLHFYYLGRKKFAFLCFFTVFVEGFLVLISRAHYSIDVVVGLTFAHYVFLHINAYIKIIDGYFTKHDLFYELNPKDSFMSKHIDSCQLS